MTTQCKTHTDHRRHGSTGVRRAATLVAACFCLLALAGCATLPTNSSPHPVDRVEVSQPVDYVITPAGPTAGASAAAIVAGFLRAGVGAADNYAVARSYIADADAVQWRPESSVLVTDGEPVIQNLGNNRFRAQLKVLGRVDAHGVYTAFATVHNTAMHLSVTRVNGQWRVSRPGDGTVVVRTDFQKVFRQRSLYFPASSGTQLVPDLRWFPNSTATPTRIASALLSGPAAWLNGAVTSAFPMSARLAADTVTVSNGTATISLNSDALQTHSLPLMQAQMEASLVGVSGIRRVQLSVNSTNVDAKSTDAKVTNRASSTASDTLVSFADRVEQLDTNAAASASASPTYEDLRGVLSMAVRGTQRVYATQNKLYVQTASGALRTLATGSYRELSIDINGGVWAIHDDRLTYFDRNGSGTIKRIGKVQAYALAPDGTRLLYVATDNPTQIKLTAIRRAPNTPTAAGTEAVNNPATVATARGSVVGLGWSGIGTTLVVSQGADTDAATIYGLNGAIDRIAAPGKVAQVVVGNSTDMVRLRLTNGSVLALRGTGWVSSAVGARGIGLVW